MESIDSPIQTQEPSFAEAPTTAPDAPETKPDQDDRPKELLTVRRFEVTQDYIRIVLSDGSSLKAEVGESDSNWFEVSWKRYSNRGAVTEPTAREDGTVGVRVTVAEGFATKQLADAGMERILAAVRYFPRVATFWEQALKATPGGTEKDALGWAMMAHELGVDAANAAWARRDKVRCICGNPDCPGGDVLDEQLSNALADGPAGIVRFLLGLGKN